jgi:hypothetical protein
MRDGSAASTATAKAMQDSHGGCSRMDFPLLACRMRWMSAAAVCGVLVLAVIAAMGVTADSGLSLGFHK